MYAVLEYPTLRINPLASNNEDGVPETKLASARFKNDLVIAVCSSQLLCDVLCAIRAIVVDDNHLPSKVTTYFHKAHVSDRRLAMLCLTQRRTFP
jgi:hypothetical protein